VEPGNFALIEFIDAVAGRAGGGVVAAGRIGAAG